MQRSGRNMMRIGIWSLALLICFIGIFYFQSKPPSKPVDGTNKPTLVGEKVQTDSSTLNKPKTNIPDYVFWVLDYVTIHHKAPEGFVGGRTFMNREKSLPVKTFEGTPISYREWDVHRKLSGQNRGPERLVTGSDRKAYYTQDHYKTFIPVP